MSMGFIRKIKTFTKSLLFHVYAGFPKCTKEEILSRFSICSQCDMYEKKSQTCMICGCNVNERKIFLNKLAWADQECPLDKWKKVIR